MFIREYELLSGLMGIITGGILNGINIASLQQPWPIYNSRTPASIFCDNA